MNRYEKIVDYWRQKNIKNSADLAEILNGKMVLFAFHSGKIENSSVTFHDTREIFEHDGVTNYSGDLRTLFEIRNAKDASELFLKAFSDNRTLDETLIKEFHYELAKNTYDSRRWQLGERPGEYKKHESQLLKTWGKQLKMNIGNKPEQIEFKKATTADMDLIFKWANDETTRKNSIVQKKIEYEEHEKWFKKICNSKEEELYIFSVEEKPVGQIRFTLNDNEATISYSIATEYRGKGYGKLMLRNAISFYQKKHPKVARFIAKVKPENIASKKCFEAAGFYESLIEYSLDLKGI